MCLGLGRLVVCHDETDNEPNTASMETRRPVKCGPPIRVNFTIVRPEQAGERERLYFWCESCKPPLRSEINRAGGRREAKECEMWELTHRLSIMEAQTVRTER